MVTPRKMAQSVAPDGCQTGAAEPFSNSRCCCSCCLRSSISLRSFCSVVSATVEITGRSGSLTGIGNHERPGVPTLGFNEAALMIDGGMLSQIGVNDRHDKQRGHGGEQESADDG